MKNHNFNFKGGEILKKMGATWFVSYSYFSLIDKNHNNWMKVKTFKKRINVYNNNTGSYHKYWLQQVLVMNNTKLNTNKIELDAIKIKEMVNKILGS